MKTEDLLGYCLIGAIFGGMIGDLNGALLGVVLVATISLVNEALHR